jgi:large subunit ribosomal protein L30
MPRTFVWHPSRGPKKAPTFKLPKSGKVRIKQIRSGIGHPSKHRLTLKAMGLKHHQAVVIQEMTPGLLGQIKQVRHMVEVTPVEGTKKEAKEGTK